MREQKIRFHNESMDSNITLLFMCVYWILIIDARLNDTIPYYAMLNIHPSRKIAHLGVSENLRYDDPSQC